MGFEEKRGSLSGRRCLEKDVRWATMTLRNALLVTLPKSGWIFGKGDYKRREGRWQLSKSRP